MLKNLLLTNIRSRLNIIIQQQIRASSLRFNHEHNSSFNQRFLLKNNNQEGNDNNSGNKQNDYQHKNRGWFNCSPFKAIIPSTLAASMIISYRNHSSSSQPPFFSDGNVSHIVEDLQQAVLEGDERRVKVLLKECTPNDVNTRNRLGWQMLHVAAVQGRFRICELLLEAGAKVNDIDHYSTPRQMAQELNIDPLVIALIRDTEFNTDLARVNFYGCTPLHYAALSNSLETIDVLIKYGANPMIKNDLGFKPSNYANPNIMKHLVKYEEEYSKREKELEEEERRKYPLEKRIKEHLVGQDAAISMVASTIRRKENGWFDEDHPLVFLFLGSSGIGKTELAKQVAKYLHKDNKKGFIRLDMSEYQEQHSVARLIGSPAGYIGYNDPNQLTDALKNCDNAVVLFDEVEKAHPKVLTVLLQLFDEGRLTDGKGNTIECKNAIFIMTSNLASEAIAEHAMQLRAEQQLAREMKLENILRANNKLADEKSEDYQEQITISKKFKDSVVRPILKAHFKLDEFLGRINEMVYFLPFSESELKQLVIKELEFWASRAKKNNSIDMTWDDKVVDVICKGYDIYYGARSIKHEVERRIINQISELHHTVKKAKKVHISINDKNSDNPDLINIKIS